MNDKEKKYSDIDLSKYEDGFKITKGSALDTAGTLKQNAQTAYKNFADAGFSSEKQGMADSILNQYLGRDKFSYDFNADALYQQYKDKYIQQGKMAMQDTMGQAAAMTGGYGNSYAASVGNQAYQAHLQNLNDVIPELYQMAYDKYNQEGQDMLNKYSLLGNAIDREYGMWNDKLGRLMADRDYYGQEESNLYNREYNAWNDKKNYDTNQYWNETNFGYGAERDRIADEQWQKNYDYQVAQDSLALIKWLQDLAYAKERDSVSDEQWQKEFDALYGDDDLTPEEAVTNENNDAVANAGIPTEDTLEGEDGEKEKSPLESIDLGTIEGQREIARILNEKIQAAVDMGLISPAAAARIRKEQNPRGYTK